MLTGGDVKYTPLPWHADGVRERRMTPEEMKAEAAAWREILKEHAAASRTTPECTQWQSGRIDSTVPSFERSDQQ